MTFVTEDKIGLKSSDSEGSRRRRGWLVLIYSGESVSASNAFRLEIVTVRPSICSIPSA